MIKSNILPGHVTVIMDGNGRWAQARGLERFRGHLEGVESVRDITEYAAQAGIRYLSLYAFSTENWNRPSDEVSGLMALMGRSVLNERPAFQKNNIRFRVIGDRDSLPPELLRDIEEAEKETENNTGLTLIVMLSYSGKWDILQAARRYAADVVSGQADTGLDGDAFSSYLSTAGIPDPDLMIRTSGEERISNYMLWQCAYTEFYFTDTLWPDFRRAEFAAALENYARRQRRFGKTEAQMEEE